MKRILSLFLTFLLLITMATGCSKGDDSSKATDQQITESVSASPDAQESETTDNQDDDETETMGVLKMATTTSTDNTGLLDYLAPLFLADTGWKLEWVSVGTGEALELGKNGDVDIVLVHAKAREEAFVEEGYGIERYQVMYNDFVIVGPADGPIAKTDDINTVFQQIVDEELVFVSRGDDSGTHTKETGIWETLGLDYEANPNYKSAGAGMSDTIIMADEMEGYCLADRGTWLSTKLSSDLAINLEIICQGDASLLNQYGVIAVSESVNPDTNLEAANAFIEWICSDDVQDLIGQFGVEEYGEPLFTPNAN